MTEPDRPAPRRQWPWWVPSVPVGLAVAALLGLMTWQVVARGPFVAWDWDVHVYVDARQPGGVTRSLLDSLASLGGQRLYTLPIIASVGLFVAYKKRRLRPLIAIGAGLATVFFVGYWIKFGLGRTPPASGQDVLHGVGQAFPSGHTANATLTWFLLVIVLFGAHGLKPDPVRFRRYCWLAAAGVFVTGGLMTTLDYHWLSDIPGGWALGLLALMVSVTVLRAPVVLPFRPLLERGRGWPSSSDQTRTAGSG
ncbi:phosphatase PAP2 family protein [Jiangella gansuensis]|uniref:phosphatase PAP2 family protein n=1 Tax=Jiangella gansuensis TaxID=281473 RepID=UPI00146F9E61|nr:phosphatase PAP2 family protein [Jiangella gansuensis]